MKKIKIEIHCEILFSFIVVLNKVESLELRSLKRQKMAGKWLVNLDILFHISIIMDLVVVVVVVVVGWS